MDLIKDKPQIIECLKKIANSEELKNLIGEKNKKGDGFLSEIFSISMENSQEQKLYLVVKSAFDKDEIRDVNPIRQAFLNEILFYTEIYPKMDLSESNELIPKCYSVSDEEKKEYLCFDNLKAFGFEMYDRKEIVDDEHLSLIFKTYGRFHGLSFAFKHAQPEEYSRLAEKLRKNSVCFTKPEEGHFNLYLRDISRKVNGYLEAENENDLVKKFQEYLDRNVIKMFDKVSKQEPDFSTIIHGDCRSNNMLFKYETTESGKKLIDMRILDFQLARVGSPVCDLSYALYSGGEKQHFDKLNDYLDMYHQSLTATLKELNCDSTVIPFDVLKSDWKKYSKYGMIMSFVTVPINIADDEDLRDLQDMANMEDRPPSHKFNEEEIYSKRALELIKHMDSIGAL